MAKSLQKIKARGFRKEGRSINEIAKTLGVSKGTVSLWCSDIALTKTQIDNLHEKMRIGGYKGRLLGASIQKERRLKKIQYFKDNAPKEIGRINKRDLLMVGLGLHLGEGNKVKNQFQFTNSNPEILKATIRWLRSLGIKNERLYCSVLVNEIHKNRVWEIENKWSQILNIPKTQFNKTVLIKAVNKKIYENNDEHLGTIVLRVSKSSDLQYRVLGLSGALLYKINTA